MRTNATTAGPAGSTPPANIVTAKVDPIEAHPYAELFPLMGAADLSGLRESLTAHGFDPQDPIVLYNDRILDGRNRHNLCCELGITPVIKHFNGTDAEALSYVLRHNLNRRHLSTSQKALVAARLLSAAGKRAKGSPTQAILSKQLSVSERSIRNAIKLLQEAPEAAARVAAGEGTVDAASGQAQKKAARGAIRAAGSDEWYTPEDLAWRARTSLGGTIDLDPATCAAANKVVQATNTFTKAKDGLRREWNGSVYLNPPFSLAAEFVDKLLRELKSGRVTAAVVVTTNATETAWCQQLMRTCTAFAVPAGRIAFTHPKGDDASQNVRGSIVWYLGTPNHDEFVSAFRAVGTVVLPTTRAYADAAGPVDDPRQTKLFAPGDKPAAAAKTARKNAPPKSRAGRTAAKRASKKGGAA